MISKKKKMKSSLGEKGLYLFICYMKLTLLLCRPISSVYIRKTHYLDQLKNLCLA